VRTESDRMSMISRLAVEYVRQMGERDWDGPRINAAIERIDTVPVRLSLDLMGDHAAARELASAICRALAREVGS
jgi:hypothetical protein